MFRSSRTGFTLVELLLVIAIIAILSAVVVIVINPGQLLMQSRDSNRVGDMTTLNLALAEYQSQVGGSMGTANTIYLSVPDPSATSTAGDQCQGLVLPSSTLTYHCAASSTYKNTNGTGWIPLNLSSINPIPPFTSLPADPTNTTSTNLYYTYASDGSTGYEVAMFLESQKNTPLMSTDGGGDPGLYDKGTNIALASGRGLIGYWNLDEGNGSTTYDLSGNNATGSWSGASGGTNGHYSVGQIGQYAGFFNGTNNFINFPALPNAPTGTRGPITITSWIKLTSCATWPMIVSFGGNLELRLMNGTCQPDFDFNAIDAVSPNAISTSTWHYIAGVSDGTTGSVYVDGAKKASVTIGSAVAISGLSFGDRYTAAQYYFPGLIDDVHIYNRALSATEIAAAYNAEK